MSYGKVKDTFWTDEKVAHYSDDAKLLALYLLTGPHRNLIGCMRLPDGYIMEDIGWDKKRIGKSLAELQERGFIVRDTSGWTHVVNQLRHDPLTSPNHVKAAGKLAESVPSGAVRDSLVEKLREAIEDLPDSYEKEVTALRKVLGSPSEGASKVLRTPEPIPAPVPEPVPEHSPARAEALAEFEIWYESYPRKKSRGAAERAYRTARKLASAEQLLAGVERFKATLNGTEPRFIAYPATWLSGKRWLDDDVAGPDKTDPKYWEQDDDDPGTVSKAH